MEKLRRYVKISDELTARNASVCESEIKEFESLSKEFYGVPINDLMFEAYDEVCRSMVGLIYFNAATQGAAEALDLI